MFIKNIYNLVRHKMMFRSTSATFHNNLPSRPVHRFSSNILFDLEMHRSKMCLWVAFHLDGLYFKLPLHQWSSKLWTQLSFLHHVSESCLILSGVFSLSVSILGSSARRMLARMAPSNTSLRFFCVRAEHSANVPAPMLRAHRRASSPLTGFSWTPARRISTWTSSCRSHWVPTRMMGTPGQRRCTSGAQRSVTLLKEDGRTTL